jgi:hypothetical protein
MSSEEEIKYELERSTLEWGIDATRGGKRHVEFYRTSMKQVILQYNGKKEDESDHHNAQQNIIGTFDSSVDFSGAIQQLIDADFIYLLQQPKDDVSVVVDSLHVANERDLVRGGASLRFVPPYLVKYDRHWRVATQSTRYKIKYEVKDEFAPFKRVDLDPFERFLQKDCSSLAAYCFAILMDRVVDITYEAYVCHHVINEEECRSCHNRHSLQWKEAVGKWGHIECRGCGSKYTVQSNSLRVRGKSSQKRIEGGEFSAFYGIHHPCKAGKQRSCSSQPNERHYLIFSGLESISKLHACIASRSDRTEQSIPVLIAEIDSCLPRCVPQSFSSPKSGGTNIEMYSWIKQVPKSRRLWFHLVIEDAINVEEMIKEVFEQQFSAEEWDRLMEENSQKEATNSADEDDAKQKKDYEGSDEYDDELSLQEGQADQECPFPSVDTETLKTELHQLRKDGSNSDADWEDAYDSA